MMHYRYRVDCPNNAIVLIDIESDRGAYCTIEEGGHLVFFRVEEKRDFMIRAFAAGQWLGVTAEPGSPSVPDVYTTATTEAASS